MKQQHHASGAERTVRATEVTMPCRLGLHARNAVKFIRFANQFESTIRIRKGTLHADGKSIIGLLMLGASWNSKLHVEAQGEDAVVAIREIETYFNNAEHCVDDT